MPEERASHTARPEILHTPTSRHERLRRAAQPLGFWTRLYANGTVRKTVLLVLLAAAWEIYARALDNPLLFPTFTGTVAALLSGIAAGELPTRRSLHAVAAAEGLCGGTRSSRRC